jgi:hypothetical protein
VVAAEIRRVAPIVGIAMSATRNARASESCAFVASLDLLGAQPTRIACNATTSHMEANRGITFRALASLLAVGVSDYDLPNLLANAPTV